MTLIRAAGRGRFIVAIAVLLVPLVLAAVAHGLIDIDLAETARVLLSAIGIGDAADVRPEYREILLRIRMPRAVLYVLVGGALSISGVTLQSTFQNAMAAPSILGISGGAALGAVLAIQAGAGEASLLAQPAAAFAGALLAMMLVYVLSHVGGRPSTTSLLLTGIAVGSLALAAVTLTMLWAKEYRLKEVLVWTVGGREEFAWREVLLVAVPVLVGGLLLNLRHRYIDALSLGEEHALSVGVPVGRVRFELLLLCALVSGSAVSVAGTIGFVGLIVPHIVRLLIGPEARILLPASFLVGGGFLVFCDLLARSCSSVDLDRVFPVGIVTSLCGVPFFLWLLVRSKRSAT